MKAYQKGILQAIPAQAVYLSFDLSPQADRSAAEAALRAVQSLADGERVVAGIGAQLAALFGAAIPGLYDFTEIPGAKMRLPATPAALWLWCRDSERGARNAEREEREEQSKARHGHEMLSVQGCRHHLTGLRGRSDK